MKERRLGEKKWWKGRVMRRGVAEEGRWGVQDLRVRLLPAESLREKEAEFSDLVMEVQLIVEKEGEKEASRREPPGSAWEAFICL